MKFLVLSNDYTGTVVHNRLTKEGHEVQLLNPFHRKNGISPVTNIFVAIANNPDCCIVCNSGFMTEVAILKSKNIKIFGGDGMQEVLETNPEVFYNFCKNYSIRYLKPETEQLCPLSTEVWFCKGEPIYQYLGYIKQAKFLAGDLGPDVDCESVVLWSYNNRDVEAVKRIFEAKLFDALKAVKYTGIVAFDSFVSEDDHYPYVYRGHFRLQAGVLSAMLEIYEENFGELIIKLINGEQTSLLLKDEIAIAVSISEPPYPFKQEGFITYLTGKGLDFQEARKLIAKKIKQQEIVNIQYRIDGGMQGEYILDLKRINFLNN